MIGQRRMTRLGRGRPSEREASEREEESESKKEAVSPHGGDSTMDESGSSFATPFRTDLKKSNLYHGIVPKGPLKGRGFYCAKGLQDEKVKSLSLKNSTVRDGQFMDCIEDPDDPFCYYNLMHHHLNNSFPPEYDGPIFLHKAPEKVRRRPERGNWPAHFEQNPKACWKSPRLW